MFICLIAGQFIRRRARFRIADVRPLNIVVLWVSLPALIFSQVPLLFRETALNGDLLFAIAMPWAHFLVAAAFVIGLGRRLNWSRGVIGALILTCGLGNTSFIGIPVVEAIFGEKAVRIAILLDQLGSFLILATLGLVVASAYSGRSLAPSVVLKRVFFFPPFLAFLLATMWGLSGLPVEGLGMEALKKIGATLVPLALLSVGWQLELSRATFEMYWRKLSWGLAFKLLVWPALVFATLLPLLGREKLVFHVTVIEAAMATMITSAVVAAEFDLEGELAQLMVGVSILLSAGTVFGWALALKALYAGSLA